MLADFRQIPCGIRRSIFLIVLPVALVAGAGVVFGVWKGDASSCILGCTTSGNAGGDERATGRDANCTHVIKDTLYPPAYIAVGIIAAVCLNTASLSIYAGAFKLHPVRWSLL